MAVFGVIFDADGVLLDSERQSLAALREAVSALTENKVILTDDLLPFVCGRGDDAILQWIRDERGIDLDPTEFRNYKLDCYRRVIAQDPIAVAAGAMSLLDELDAGRVPYAIATGAIRAKISLSLAAVGLHGRFRVIVSVDEVGVGKPQPEIFLLAAKRLGLPPARLIVFEDTISGVEAANRAGMLCVAIAGTFERERLSRARHVIGSLCEVNLSVLRQWIDGCSGVASTHGALR